MYVFVARRNGFRVLIENYDRQITAVVILKPRRSLVAHDLAEYGARVSELRINRRHSQIPSGLELEMRVLQRVVHPRHLSHSVAQELAIVVQPEETRDI